mmetsp:Transcript_30000/g.73070  ORF Transcript_30000/g.73070 Transcript_30000/m.73070 type:complete len:318 (+) Transcript_30000:221-1174(+)
MGLTRKGRAKRCFYFAAFILCAIFLGYIAPRVCPDDDCFLIPDRQVKRLSSSWTSYALLGVVLLAGVESMAFAIVYCVSPRAARRTGGELTDGGVFRKPQRGWERGLNLALFIALLVGMCYATSFWGINGWTENPAPGFPRLSGSTMIVGMVIGWSIVLVYVVLLSISNAADYGEARSTPWSAALEKCDEDRAAADSSGNTGESSGDPHDTGNTDVGLRQSWTAFQEPQTGPVDRQQRETVVNMEPTKAAWAELGNNPTPVIHGNAYAFESWTSSQDISETSASDANSAVARPNDTYNPPPRRATNSLLQMYEQDQT